MSDEPAFILKVRDRAARGEESYQNIIATIESVRDAIYQLGGKATAAAFLAKTSSLLQENDSSSRNWQTPSYLVMICRLSIEDVSPNMRAKMGDQISKTIIDTCRHLCKDLLENAAQNSSDVTVTNDVMQTSGRILRTSFEILTVIFESLLLTKPDSFCPVKKSILEFAWNFCVSERIHEGITMEGTLSRGVSSKLMPPVTSQLRQKAQHLYVLGLKCNKVITLGSVSYVTSLYLSNACAKETRYHLKSLLVSKNSNGPKKEEDGFASLQLLLSFLKMCLKHIQSVPHITTVCNCIFDILIESGVHPIAVQALEILAYFFDHCFEDIPTTETDPKIAIATQLRGKIIKHSVVAVADANYCTAQIKFMAILQKIILRESTKSASARFNDFDLLNKMMGEFLDFADSPAIQKAVVVHVGEVICELKSLGMWLRLPAIVGPLVKSPKFKQSRRTLFLIIAQAFDVWAELKRQHYFSSPEAWDLVAPESQTAVGLLKELSSLYEEASNGELFGWLKEFQLMIRSAFTAFGARAVLEIFPLRVLETELSDPQFERNARSWMLLSLKSGCKYGKIKLFVQEFMGLATKLESRVEQAAKKGMMLVSKKYQGMVDQVWSLMPGFFTCPVDFADAMTADQDRFAKIMCHILVSKPELRDYCAISLIQMCKSLSKYADTDFEKLKKCVVPAGASQESKDSSEDFEIEGDDQEDESIYDMPSDSIIRNTAERDLKCVQYLAPKMLPKVFSAYLEVQSGSSTSSTAVGRSGQLLLECIRCFAECIDSNAVAEQFRQVVERLLKHDADVISLSKEIEVLSTRRVENASKNAMDVESGNSSGSFSTLAERKNALAPLLEKKVETEKKVEILANCAAACVPYLPRERLEFVLKTFESVLLNSLSTGTQRACYRAIRAVFEHSEVTEITPEILEKFWSILRESRILCEPGAYKARLQTMQSFLTMLFGAEDDEDYDYGAEDSEDEEDDEAKEDKKVKSASNNMNQKVHISDEVKREFLTLQLIGSQTVSSKEDVFLISELLARSHDVNFTARRLAKDCLFIVFRAAILDLDLSMELIASVGADLTSKSAVMKAHSVDALAKLLYKHGGGAEGSEGISVETLDRICEVVLILLKDQDKQVFKSVLQFVKVMCHVVPLSLLKKRTLFYQDGMNENEFARTSSFLYDLLNNPHANTARLAVRRVIEKLLKRLVFYSSGENNYEVYSDDEDSDEENDNMVRDEDGNIIPSGAITMENFREAFPKRHIGLLNYIDKELHKRYKKKTKSLIGKKLLNQKTDGTNAKKKLSYEQFFREEEDDVENELAKSMGGLSVNSAKQETKMKRQRRLSTDTTKENEEGGDAMTDLLDAWEAHGNNDGFESGNRSKSRRLHKHSDGVGSLNDLSENGSIFDASANSIFSGKRGNSNFDISAAPSTKSIVNNMTKMWFQDANDGDGVVDFNDSANASKNLLTKHKESSRSSRSVTDSTTGEKKRTAEEEGVRIMANGKILVEEENTDDDDEDEDVKGASGSKSKGHKAGSLSDLREKRLKMRGTRAEKKNHVVRGLDHYAPGTKARGDVKRKGVALDPYAYVSLNPRLFKEKHRNKSINAFKNITAKAPERGNKAKKVQKAKVTRSSGSKSSKSKATKKRR